MNQKEKKEFILLRLGRDLRKYAGAYVLVLPVVLFYLIFCYKPMYGIIIAFQNFSPIRGIAGSEWVGLQHFKDFFESYYFTRILKNTLIISLSTLVFSFPMPILFALLLNEIRNQKFKRLVQTISYMPHFISMVVVCNMIKMFTSNTGFITSLLGMFGVPEASLLTKPEYFVPIYVISGIWQQTGWGAIIYLSALAGIDQQLYEAAKIDGANRWKQTLYVTLPGISQTIIIMLLLRIGNIMDVGYEKVMLLYNEGIFKTADVISTFVYRKGLTDMEFSYSTAVSLFNSVINFIIIVVFNKLSKKLTETSLW